MIHRLFLIILFLAISTLSHGVLNKYHKRADFIEDILGRPEETFQKNPELFRNIVNVTTRDGRKIFTLKTPKGTFQAGSFEELSLGDLQARSQIVDSFKRGTFNVIEGLDTKNDSWFAQNLDVAGLQALSENRDAVFQVASNFNALETTHADQNIEKQKLSDYIFDNTQGPAASISAAPGLVFRRYLFFYDKEKLPKTWGQTMHHFVDFLDGVKNTPFRMTAAGYPVFVQKNSGAKQSVDDSYEHIKIGFQGDTQVTFGASNGSGFHEYLNDKNQFINQVFTAALDLGNTNSNIANNTTVQRWAQVLLNAAYEGTLRVAYVKDKKKVFLTLVGGGVFHNRLEWIFNALERMKDFISASGLEVILIMRARSSNKEQDWLRERLLALVNWTGGKYTRYTDEGMFELLSGNNKR